MTPNLPQNRGLIYIPIGGADPQITLVHPQSPSPQLVEIGVLGVLTPLKLAKPLQTKQKFCTNPPLKPRRLT